MKKPQHMPFPGSGGAWRVVDGQLVPDVAPPVPSAAKPLDVEPKATAPTPNPKAPAPRPRKHQE